MLNKIEHVAIAVKDLDLAISLYTQTWGLELAHRERVESEQVDEAMLRIGESYIQLLSPTTSDSTIARFLEKRGEGIHHIAFEVDSAPSAAEYLTSMGLRILGGGPRPGSRDTVVAFVDPRSNSGVLAELVGSRTS